ncbi:Sec-independent protein translocase protein TatB [Yersinia nurmii]|uniref:Sec-independent protein translocase protein TatB n=1 Tax=Yersinia nurmii TaxID=685706 RepID=A0AAW7KAY9_9GAMM|nr:Sec-independent protein translocase protein TatB [Yersinia nurmii]MDN0089146.1 Sec-independent protein translocase protein TatB [Yersinia nurmii]CNF04226.1 Sec-independent protein translocase protein TatB [Yersinia nurmii]
MFDIGFSELLLVMVIGLVVLGPERLPVAVRTVAGWIRALRSLAATVQNELSQELKLQEFQDSLKKAEQAGLQNLTPELKASMDELKDAAESLKRSYRPDSALEQHTIHNPLVTDPEAIHDGVTPAESATVASAPVKAPEAPVDLEKHHEESHSEDKTPAAADQPDVVVANSVNPVPVSHAEPASKQPSLNQPGGDR